MCERQIIRVVLDDAVLKHSQGCRNHFFLGFWSGVVVGIGFVVVTIASVSVVPKLISAWW